MASQPYIIGKRDLRLDFIRGYALVAMTVTHLALATPLIFVTGGSQFLFNAAEVFLFISGFTIGIISAGRTLEHQIKGRLGRTWTLYRYLILFSFIFMAAFIILEPPESTRGSQFSTAISTLTLGEAQYEMDILVAYVAYLAAAPLALWGLHRGKTRLVLAILAAIYAISYIDPASTTLHFAAFRHLGTNSPLFFGPLILGFHRKAAAEWWRAQPWRKAADIATLALGMALGIWFIAELITDTEMLRAFVGNFAQREFRLPPQAIIVIGLYMRVIWLLTTRLWKFLNPALGWLVLPLGRDSLFTYCMHVVALLIVGFFEPPDGNLLVGLGVNVAVLLALLGIAHLRALTVPYMRRQKRLALLNSHLLNALTLTAVALFVAAVAAFGQGSWSIEYEFPYLEDGEEPSGNS